jgi:UDP-N-acetylmuramoylalanine-D-glutamate ligase
MKQATRQKARRQNQGSFNDMVVELNAYRKKKLIILPRNVRQEDYLELLDDSQKAIVLATGPAGTGKTMLAVQKGIQKILAQNFVNYEKCQTLKNAFDKALIDTKSSKLIEKNIILSPACASFDQWKNFEERGDFFCKLVNDI